MFWPSAGIVEGKMMTNLYPVYITGSVNIVGGGVKAGM